MKGRRRCRRRAGWFASVFVCFSSSPLFSLDVRLLSFIYISSSFSISTGFLVSLLHVLFYFFFCILLCLLHVCVFFYSSLCIHFRFASRLLYFFFLFFSCFFSSLFSVFFFSSLFLFFSLPPLKVRRGGLYIACTQFYLGKDSLH